MEEHFVVEEFMGYKGPFKPKNYREIDKKDAEKTIIATTNYNAAKINPVSGGPITISTNGRCGPAFGNTTCPGSQCCSPWGWCGGTLGTHSDWCINTTRGNFDPRFDGTMPVPLKNHWEGCTTTNQCVPGYQCLVTNINIGNGRCLTKDDCEWATSVDRSIGNCNPNVPMTSSQLDEDLRKINEDTTLIQNDNVLIDATYKKYNDDILDFNDAVADFNKDRDLLDANNFASLKDYLNKIYNIITNYIKKCDKKDSQGIYEQLNKYNVLMNDTYEYIYLYTYCTDTVAGNNIKQNIDQLKTLLVQ